MSGHSTLLRKRPQIAGDRHATGTPRERGTSSVSSGWNEAARYRPERTNTGSPSSSPRTSTSTASSSIFGARMKTPRRGTGSPISETSASKLATWRPYPLRRTTMSSAPNVSWPGTPSTASRASRIIPAQVPNTVPPNERTASSSPYACINFPSWWTRRPESPSRRVRRGGAAALPRRRSRRGVRALLGAPGNRPARREHQRSCAHSRNGPTSRRGLATPRAWRSRPPDVPFGTRS